ncbi:hypothetical protein BDQ17DRAFT_1322191 [Cyathus striatus]|nr:hypothetical protein BDQ17DRAFT_1322191 [Cyathus striatus]
MIELVMQEPLRWGLLLGSFRGDRDLRNVHCSTLVPESRLFTLGLSGWVEYSARGTGSLRGLLAIENGYDDSPKTLGEESYTIATVSQGTLLGKPGVVNLALVEYSARGCRFMPPVPQVTPSDKLPTTAQSGKHGDMVLSPSPTKASLWPVIGVDF